MNLNTPIPTHYGELVGRFRLIWEEQISKLAEKFGAAIEGVVTPWERAVDVPVICVKPAALVQLADYIKSDSGFGYGFLVDITATDELPRRPRFDVVYQLFSHKNFARIRLKVGAEESGAVPSLVGVWSGANWAEREVWDMYGIRFDGHPDLRRILMDERWVGHPLRKDYPLRGYQIFPLAEPIDPKLLE